MSQPFNKLITIQKIDELTEEWEDVFNVHCRVNKSKSDSEYTNAGAIQAKRSLVFEIRYFKQLEAISYNTQAYRVLFQDIPFNIEDFDDYKLQHKTVKLLGVSY